MRKKYLSALLFGALLFASAGTFTSCKDYDDDINNLQTQITANAQGIEELKNLVGNGDYVTNIEKSAEGLVVTFKNAGTQTITLEDKVGSVVTVNEDGVLCIDGEPTEIKVAESTPGEGAKAPIKIDGGFWAVLNENGEYDKTNIPVSGVSLAGDKQTGYTLTIVNADGSTSSVELPSAASSITSLKLAENVANYELTIPYAISGTAGKSLINVNKEKLGDIVNTYTADGKKGAYVDVVITPATVDPKDLSFTLQDSKGETIFNQGTVEDETPLLEYTRATSTGVHRIYFTYADGIDTDDIEDYGKLALSVACGTASTQYSININGEENPATEITANTVYVKLNETYNIFGEGFEKDPTVYPKSISSEFLTITDGLTDVDITNITDAKLTIDETRAKLYGITVEGTSFQIASEDAYGLEIPFTLVYTDNTTIEGAEPKTISIKVKVQAKPVASAVTLSATHELSTDETKKYVYIPLADLAAAIDGANKIAWNEATSLDVVTIENNGAGTNLKLTSANKYNGSKLTMTENTEIKIPTDYLYKSDKTSKASNLAEAAYLKVEIDPKSPNVTADTYSSMVEFKFGGKTAQGTIELKLTNPAVLTRIASLFDGDNVVAYGNGNSGNGAIFNVLSVYNTVGVSFGSNPTVEVEEVTNKANWVEGSYTPGDKKLTITIPSKEQMYTDTRKVTVTYNLFAGSTNNTFKDSFYVTAKSPIKEGTIDALKTTLELGQSKSATFTNSDFSAKDVWGTTYRLFGVETFDNPETQTDEYNWAAPSQNIQMITFEPSSSLISVTPTYKKMATTDTDYKYMTGFKVTVDDEAGLQSGDQVTIKITITDMWGMTTEKDVTLTVVK